MIAFNSIHSHTAYNVHTYSHTPITHPCTYIAIHTRANQYTYMLYSVCRTKPYYSRTRIIPYTRVHTHTLMYTHTIRTHVIHSRANTYSFTRVKCVPRTHSHTLPYNIQRTHVHQIHPEWIQDYMNIHTSPKTSTTLYPNLLFYLTVFQTTAKTKNSSTLQLSYTIISHYW